MVRFALKNAKKSALTLIGVAALSLTMAGPALAADGTSATVTGGSLTITNPLADDFVGANISGEAQTTTAALATFSVSDLTGTGAGWNVTAQASRFQGGTHNLAYGSLSMSQPTVLSPNTDSLDPSITTGPYVLDAESGTTAGQIVPVKIASAATDTGMGEYDFSATTLTLALPADVYADTYLSTVTISIVSAP
jgi:hypothetical protein